MTSKENSWLRVIDGDSDIRLLFFNQTALPNKMWILCLKQF